MPQSVLRAFVRGAVELIFPSSCWICESPGTELDQFRHGLCTACFGAVTADPHHLCLRCGQIVGPHADMTDGCAECHKVAYGFQSVIRLGKYDGRLREAILRMKTSAGESLAENMGRVFGECRKERLLSTRSSLVVPVPLHWRRSWRRGYNQAAAVAEHLARSMGVPCACNCLRRVRNTPQQLQPSASARRENVRGAFRVRRGANVDGKRILLVDDVMTTGSTASEASRTLKAAGAAEITVAVLARR
jgi:ComF family protein